MHRIVNIFLIILAIAQSACSQISENKLLGSWVLSSNYESPDIIIFRSDHKYFVYNANSVNAGSLGLTDNLKGNDILINDAYTSLTEIGMWDYNQSSKKLILKEREILDTNSDFSRAYSVSSQLEFYVKRITEYEIEICYEKHNEKLCDKYDKNWSYTSDKKIKISYQEIIKEFSGTSNDKEEVYLSGYETELQLRYIFFKEADKLIIESEKGKELFSTEMESTNGERTKLINLNGVTKLVFKIESSQPSSKWKFRIDLK